MASGLLMWAVMTILSAFVSAGFSLHAVVSTTGQSKTNALYAAARSLAIAATSIVPLLNHSQSWLLAIAVVMTIVQAIDAGIGALNREPVKTYGPAAFFVLNALAIIWLVKG